MKQNINVKIMKKPELTDEQIRSHMQFDKVLEAYKVTGPVRAPKKWFYIAGYGASAVVIISAALYFFYPGPNRVEPHLQPSQTPVVDSSTSKRPEAIQEVSKPDVQEKKVEISQPKTITKESEHKIVQTDSAKTSSRFTEAEPKDGYSALYEYFDRELKYPHEAAKDSIQGIVTVSFAINKDGKPDQIKIENSLGSAFDKECQRVIIAMPLWKPATINGKPISARLSIPLAFKIKK